MKLYQMKATPQAVNRMAAFLNDNYVSIGDSTGGSEDAFLAFTEEMQDGDYVMIADEDWVYLGDLGDYFEMAAGEDALESDIRHRRGVTWLNAIRLDELNADIQAFLMDPAAVAAFELPLEAAQLDRWLQVPPVGGIQKQERAPQSIPSGKPFVPAGPVEAEVVAEALAVLKLALRSEDPERRERAAIAILRYAK